MKEFGAKNAKWDYDHMYEFLKAPGKYISGTNMTFVGLKKPEDRVALIAYLHTLGSTLPVPAPKPAGAPADAAAAPAEGGAATTAAAPAPALLRPPPRRPPASRRRPHRTRTSPSTDRFSVRPRSEGREVRFAAFFLRAALFLFS
jgi:cytochrome c